MSGRVWLISNVYGDLDAEIRSRQNIIKWRYKSTTEERFEQLGFKKDQIQTPLVADRSHKYQLVTPSGLIRPCTKMIAKGCAVLNHFYTILQQDYGLNDDDSVVYFDGDGQIDYDSVLKVVEKLKTSNFVLCNRGDNPGIPSERLLIEKFENSFLEDAFSVTLPDVQCGCWGLTGKHLKEIYGLLTAEAFEIELDLTLSSLGKGVKPEYVDVRVKSPSESTFKSGEDDFHKLLFLMEKFRIDQGELLLKSQKFAKKYDVLPKEYTKYFSYGKVRDLKFK